MERYFGESWLNYSVFLVILVGSVIAYWQLKRLERYETKLTHPIFMNPWERLLLYGHFRLNTAQEVWKECSDIERRD